MADAATLVFDIDSSGAAGAARALAGLERYAASTATAAAKLETTFRKSNGQFKSQVQHVAENQREIRRLAASYNTTLSAQLRFSDQQKELARAVQLGVVSNTQQVEILRRLQAEYTQAATASVAFAGAQRNSALQSANVFAQLNDIGVMMAAGQNPIQLALQQGTQLNQVWASMGAQGRSLAGVGRMIGGAIVSMISPMNLLTIGVIAGGAALVSWLTASEDAGSGADAFSDKLGTLQGYVDALNDSLTLTLPANFDKVLEKYGSLNQQVREHVASMDAINAQLLSISSINITNMFKEDFGGWLTTQIDEMRIAFGRTNDNARHLLHLMDAIDNAKGPKNQADALDNMIRELVRAAGGVENLNTKQAEFVLKLQQARDTALQAVKNLEKLSAPINSATSAASRFLSVLEQIADAPFAPSLTRFTPFDAGLGSPLAPTSSIRPPRAPSELGLPESPKRGGVGGGGGGRGQAERGFQSLRELLEQESLFQVAEYEKRQKQLDAALNRRLISEKNYQEMRKQLQLVYFGSEFEVNALNYALDLEQLNAANTAKLLSEEQYLMKRQQLQWDYLAQADSVNASLLSQELSNWGAHFGDMNSLAGGGYDSLLRLQKSFAAASALMNTWLGYTKALAEGPPMTPWMRLAWAGKILAAGMGAVNAIKGGGKSGGGAASTAQAAAREEPTRNVLVRLQGDEWLTGLAEQIMTEIYEQSGNGRVIVARDY